MGSVHIPYRAGDGRWFEYEQQWKRTCLDLLNSHVPPDRRPLTRVLDFGSGRGEFLSLMKNEGYACEGADGDGECVRMCSEIAPTRVVTDATLSQVYEEASFDVACAIHVLEHVHDPAALVDRLMRLARRFLLLAVPNLHSSALIPLRGKPYTANGGHVCGWDFAHFRGFLTRICGLEILALLPDFVPFTTKFARLDRVARKTLPRAVIRRWETGPLLRWFPYLSNSIVALCARPPER
jgi:SAM-dependent methyltransferase